MDIINAKKELSNNLKELMITNRLKQKDMLDELSKMGFEVKQQNLSKWMNGESFPRDQNIISAFCVILNCQRSDLIPEANPVKPHPTFLEVTKKRFPVLGEVAAGKPIWMNEDKDCFVMADAEINADYVLIARGDSMVGIGIKNGDLMFIKKQDIVRNEEVAVVAIDEEATLKRVIYDKLNNKITLKAENPKYEDLVYSGEQLDHIKILGRAVFYQSLIQ